MLATSALSASIVMRLEPGKLGCPGNPARHAWRGQSGFRSCYAGQSRIGTWSSGSAVVCLISSIEKLEVTSARSTFPISFL